ncbi:hypothetical protein llap_2644 [Limosa lapponica baueri]|uniref:Uncharacterized protein n=1 Tax=Limosa lapponica baueri TaxID=1758121 RepID=A0A2I0ULZ4_LIMLA|nr:hypothetical protein llap_2644 [Limosa lapponica baueri]
MNIDFGSQSPSQSGTVSVGSLEALSPGSSSSTSQPDGRYLKAAVGVACSSSPSDGGDYTEMTFGMATTPPQPIVQKPESARVTSPTAGVIRADPQGRRRHSSETFSSTTTVTPVSPSFAHNPKRHNSASVENNGLNYIAIDVVDGTLANCDKASIDFLSHNLKEASAVKAIQPCGHLGLVGPLGTLEN